MNLNEKINTTTNTTMMRTNEKFTFANDEKLETSWKNIKIDFNRFRDIFEDDLPVIVYDILFWSVLINMLSPIGNHHLNLNVENVFAMYNT